MELLKLITTAVIDDCIYSVIIILHKDLVYEQTPVMKNIITKCIGFNTMYKFIIKIKLVSIRRLKGCFHPYLSIMLPNIKEPIKEPK